MTDAHLDLLNIDLDEITPLRDRFALMFAQCWIRAHGEHLLDGSWSPEELGIQAGTEGYAFAEGVLTAREEHLAELAHQEAEA